MKMWEVVLNLVSLTLAFSLMAQPACTFKQGSYTMAAGGPAKVVGRSAERGHWGQQDEWTVEVPNLQFIPWMYDTDV